MPSRSNVEVALHLVSFQTPEYPAILSWAGSSRGFAKLPLLHPEPAGLPQDVRGVRVALQLLLMSDSRPVQVVDSSSAHPVAPGRGFLAQQIARQDPVARCILNVDVQVGTGHGDHNVEVDLEVVRHAFFNGEKLGFIAAVPAADFGKGKKSG